MMSPHPRPRPRRRAASVMAMTISVGRRERRRRRREDRSRNRCRRRRLRETGPMTLTRPLPYSRSGRLWRQIEEALAGPASQAAAAFGVGGVVFGGQGHGNARRVAAQGVIPDPHARWSPVGRTVRVPVRPRRRRGGETPPHRKATKSQSSRGVEGPCAYSPRTAP